MEEGLSKSGIKLLTAEESARGVIEVIETLDSAVSGKLISWDADILT